MTVCPNDRCKYNNILPKKVVTKEANGIDRVVEIWHSFCVKCETKLPLNEMQDAVYICKGLDGELEWRTPLIS